MNLLFSKDLTLVMGEASDPVDIIWRNMGGTRGVYFLRKFIFNVIGLFVVFFVTTPAAIYSSLKMLEAFKFLDVTNSISDDTFFGSLVIAYFPPLVIIFINNILIYGIYYAAYWEKQVTHSNY